MKKLLLFAVCICCATLVSCGSKESDTSAIPVDQTEQQLPIDKFLESKLHIKVDITDSSVTPSRELRAEAYVDSEGDGEGLLQFNGELYDVSIANNTLYVHVASGIVVKVSDITARFNFSSADIEDAVDLEAYGFTMSGDTPVAYAARRGNVSIAATYELSEHTFDTPSVTSSETRTLSGVCEYIIDYSSPEQETANPVDEEQETEDFYVNSKYGVAIEGRTYSVGDTMNPATYFNSQSPEGVLSSTEYKKDSKVILDHVSYLTTTGRVVFVSVSNYVTSIEATGDWSFLGISSGTSTEDLELMIGYKLSKRELETFVPIDPSLEVLDKEGSNYICSLGDLYIELRCEKSILSEIYITQDLEFKES